MKKQHYYLLSSVACALFLIGGGVSDASERIPGDGRQTASFQWWGVQQYSQQTFAKLSDGRYEEMMAKVFAFWGVLRSELRRVDWTAQPKISHGECANKFLHDAKIAWLALDEISERILSTGDAGQDASKGLGSVIGNFIDFLENPQSNVSDNVADALLAHFIAIQECFDGIVPYYLAYQEQATENKQNY